MITPQSQIKINLPVKLRNHLKQKAGEFGVPVSLYVKHLIIKDLESLDYPVFQASERTEKAYNKALRERKKAVRYLS